MTYHPTMRNLDIDLRNNGTNNIDAKLTGHFRNPFIDEEIVAEYDMGITRFECPLTSIPIHEILDSTKYTITIQTYAVKNVGNAGVTIEGTADMYNSTEYPIYSPENFVENVNLTLMRAWRGLLDDLALYDDTANLTAAAFTHSASTQNLVITNTGSTNTAYVSLKISNFTQTSQVGSEQDYVDIILTNPAGTDCYVASNVLLTGDVEFYDGANRYLSQLPENRTISGAYNPSETFMKFMNEAGTGTFVLTIRPSHANSLDITCDVELQVYTNPKLANRYDYPSSPPNYSLDTATGLLSLRVSEKFISSGLVIKMDSAPLEICQIAARHSNGNYIVLPEVTLSSILTDTLVIPAERPRMAYINQMYKLLVSTNSFNIVPDHSNNDLRSNAITSYLIPSESIYNLDYVRFNVSDPWRKYSLTKMTIQSYEFVFEVEYRDGSKKTVQLQPNQFCNLLVTFFKR